MTQEEFVRIQEEEDKTLGFILSYYNGRFARTYEKRFAHRREMNEFIERNHITAFDIQRYFKGDTK